MSTFENKTPTDSEADEGFLWGVRAIAEFVRRPPRATNHLLATGQLPGTKIGQTWTSTKDRIRARLRGEG